MWRQLIIPLYETSLEHAHGMDVRRLLAKLNADNPRLPLDLFNYEEKGRTYTGLSPYRFAASKGIFSLTAIGGGSVFTLENAAADVVGMLSGHVQKDLSYEWRIGEARISLNAYRSRYAICKMIVQNSQSLSGAAGHVNKKRGEALRSGGVDHPLVKEWVRLAIERNLMRQSDLLFAEYPENDEIEFSVTHIGKMAPVKVKDRVSRMAAFDVEFETNLEIQGVWHAGSLISYGYGFIRKVRSEKARNTSRASQ